ncbi:RNA polymerase sigma factor [Patescibacteria group bacterium]|nr:RNA polymerase sigma factor [Patescibacteria group bacterium]
MNKKINKLKLAILVKKVRQGDDEAFGKIYDEYIKKIYNFIFFKTPSKEIAEDLTHEVFIGLLEYLKKTEHLINELQGLIYKIARNKIADYYKRIADKDRNLELKEEIATDFSAELQTTPGIELENVIDQKMDIKLVMKCIEKINNKSFEEVIILRFIDDLSLKEISKSINKSVSATSITLYRAINKLREILKEIKNDN